MVQFLTRQGCHLCEEARPLLQRAARRARVDVIEIDIESDDRLIALWGLKIPVVLGPGEQVVAEGPIEDWRSLARKLRRAKKG